MCGDHQISRVDPVLQPNKFSYDHPYDPLPSQKLAYTMQEVLTNYMDLLPLETSMLTTLRPTPKQQVQIRFLYCPHALIYALLQNFLASILEHSSFVCHTVPTYGIQTPSPSQRLFWILILVWSPGDPF
jgi:hypothetical protein